MSNASSAIPGFPDNTDEKVTTPDTNPDAALFLGTTNMSTIDAWNIAVSSGHDNEARRVQAMTLLNARIVEL